MRKTGAGCYELLLSAGVVVLHRRVFLFPYSLTNSAVMHVLHPLALRGNLS